MDLPRLDAFCILPFGLGLFLGLSKFPLRRAFHSGSRPRQAEEHP